MFRMIATGLAGLAMAMAGASATAMAQAPATKGAPEAAAAPNQGFAAMPGAKDVLGTVTSRGQTNNITKADLVSFLSRYPVPPADERELAYNQAMEMIAGAHLFQHYLMSQRIQVPDSKVDAEVENARAQLKKQGQDLDTILQQNGSSEKEMRKEIADRVRMDEFMQAKATDAALRRFLNENRDKFSGTQVRASHILLKLEPTASREQKEKVKKKIEEIRKEIIDGKIPFAAAANKYSEDPANASGSGGDLDYFRNDGSFVEEFTDAAFKLKKGEISGPVKTPLGYHLIFVTDRIEGKFPDFEANKAYLTQAFRAELQKEIVNEERKSAKIEIKPMPRDLYPATEQPAAGAAAPATAPAKP